MANGVSRSRTPHSPDRSAYLGAVLYAVILALVLIASKPYWAWVALLALGGLAVAANVIGVIDMTARVVCTYCLLTTAASPLLLWALWRLK
jgi:hypothetical protein